MSSATNLTGCSPQSHLIDVRSPAEFSTGHLVSDIAPTINIEYQSISSLPAVYAARGITVHKTDPITLYCRSGRRSNLALQTLRSEGYINVRDIGGYEDAKRVLDKEQVTRQLEAEMQSLMESVERGEDSGDGQAASGEKKMEDPKKHARAKSFGALVQGLKELEES